MMKIFLPTILFATSLIIIQVLTLAQAAEMHSGGSNHNAMQHGDSSHGKHQSSQGKRDNVMNEPMMHDSKAVQHQTKTSLADKILPPPASKLSVLEVIPPSGKVREGGYDGRYVMESTSSFDSIEDQCAKASRGLVILDNKSWSQCDKMTKGIRK